MLLHSLSIKTLSVAHPFPSIENLMHFDNPAPVKTSLVYRPHWSILIISGFLCLLIASSINFAHHSDSTSVAHICFLHPSMTTVYYMNLFSIGKLVMSVIQTLLSCIISFPRNIYGNTWWLLHLLEICGPGRTDHSSIVILYVKNYFVCLI